MDAIAMELPQLISQLTPHLRDSLLSANLEVQGAVLIAVEKIREAIER